MCNSLSSEEFLTKKALFVEDENSPGWFGVVSGFTVLIICLALMVMARCGSQPSTMKGHPGVHSSQQD